MSSFDLNLTKRKLLLKYPLFGSILANTNFQESHHMSTAATDGNNIYYNPEFMESLNDNQQVFILAHEVAHIAFDHIYRSEGKDPEIWNIATDAIINDFLKKDGLEHVDGCVNIENALNYDAEELYTKLIDKRDKQKGSKGNGQGQSDASDTEQSSNSENASNNQNNNSNGKNAGHDDHTIWKQAVENKNKQSQGSSQGEDKDKNESKGEESNSSDNKDGDKEKQEAIDKLTKMGEKKAYKQNKIAREKQLDELRKELAKESCKPGNATESDKVTFKDIGVAKPLIDWRYFLKEAIKCNVDWSFDDATIEDGVVKPHLKEFAIPETEIVLDTSGSVSDTLLKNFLRECKNILLESKVKVGCFDTRFYGFKEIKKIEDIDTMTFQGRGGTDFDVAVNAFSKRVMNKIIFTDGEASMPKKDVRAIWVVYGNTKINPKKGKVIYIDEKQLEKLSKKTNNRR